MTGISYKFLTSGNCRYLKHQTDSDSDTAFGDSDNGTAYCCTVCAAEITSGRFITTVNGEHQHTKSNPQGHYFSIRCFTAAPGCDNRGVATEEYTWFAGYKWQVALCASCGIQLGWRFSGDGEFFALVSDSIQECEQ